MSRRREASDDAQSAAAACGRPKGSRHDGCVFLHRHLHRHTKAHALAEQRLFPTSCARTDRTRARASANTPAQVATVRKNERWPPRSRRCPRARAWASTCGAAS